MRLLITRPIDRCQALVEAIQALGGMLIPVPIVSIIAPQDLDAVERVYQNINTFDLAIFVSPNAVKPHLPLLTIPVLAIGPSTQHQLEQHGLEQHGIKVTRPAYDFSSEGLLNLSVLQAQEITGKRIVVFCGENPRMLLSETLKQRGASVTLAYTYARCPTNINLQAALENWQCVGIDGLVATSAESLYNLLSMLGNQGGGVA